MAAPTYSLTGTLTDLIGTNTLRVLEGWVESSEPNGTITDTTNNQSRLGRYPIAFAADGSWTVSGLPATGATQWSPPVAYYQVRFRARDAAPYSSTQTYASGQFALTANSQYKDVDKRDPQAITPEVTAAVTEAATRAEAAAAEAEAAADRAEDAAGTSAGPMRPTAKVLALSTYVSVPAPNGSWGDLHAGMTVTFTAPASGAVLIRLDAWLDYNSGTLQLRAANAATGAPLGESPQVRASASSISRGMSSFAIPVNGLAAGQTYTVKLQQFQNTTYAAGSAGSQFFLRSVNPAVLSATPLDSAVYVTA